MTLKKTLKTPPAEGFIKGIPVNSVCKKRLYAATGKRFRGKQLMNICG